MRIVGGLGEGGGQLALTHAGSANLLESYQSPLPGCGDSHFKRTRRRRNEPLCTANAPHFLEASGS